MLDSPTVPAEMLPQRAFYFLRHGETQYNLERRFQGSIDVPLNDNGVAQAKRAAEILTGKGFTRIVSSPANRVLKTASFTAEASGAPMHIDADLMEFNVGSFEGRDIIETKRAHGLDEDASFMTILPDDAENWHEFVPRICASVRRWTDQHASDITFRQNLAMVPAARAYANETLLIAAHGLVFRALTVALAEQHLVSQNAEPYFFQPTNSGWHIERLD